MRQGTPSRTAMRVALRRAAHQLLDAPLVLHDPVALRIIGDDRAAELRRDPGASSSSPIDPYMRAFMAARSRFAEDVLAVAYARGVRQYVLLGAGLDTFAYRNPFRGLRVFEVDHPDTQQWKRWRLDQGHIDVPESLTFAPVNFETHTVEQGLAAAGLDRAAPAQFAMLGVVPYLTPEALDATWGYVGAGPAGSGIVFDYSIPREQMNRRQRRVFDGLADRVAAAGEPWKTHFVPQSLHHRLALLGFTDVDDLDGAAINKRYFANRSDQLRVGGTGRLISARA